MQIRTYVEDFIDGISLVLGVLVGLAVAISLHDNFEESFIESRGKYAIGGEFILYALVFFGVAYIVFQIVTNIGHKLDRMDQGADQ